MGEVPNIDLLAADLRSSIGHLPTCYLGLPLGAPYKNMEAWGPVINRVQKAGRSEGSYLSKGGRVTLIKAVLVSIPSYYMSLLVIPGEVANQIKKHQRDFLWKGEEDGRGHHLVAWSKVCSSKQKGGLGLRRLEAIIKALLCKWLWRFGVEEDSL